MRKLSLIIFTILSTTFLYAQPSSDKLIRRGVSLHDKGQYHNAITCFQEALKINPQSMSATYELSLSYLHLKDYDNALKYSTKVINANFQPLLIDAYCVKSSALAELNRVEESIKLLNEALDRCGDEYLIHYNLGLSYFKLRNLTNARNHLQKAIEIDPTHPSAILLYSYTLNDSDRWIQSVLSFHFFLLLEPNTDRSKDAFSELYDILEQQLAENSNRLLPEDGIDRKALYNEIQNLKTQDTSQEARYIFFEKASQLIFFTLSQLQNDSRRGLLWDFYVPIYAEILESGYFSTYCRYVSSSSLPQSLEWWNEHKTEVDKFISWFEEGQNTPEDEYASDFDDETEE